MEFKYVTGDLDKIDLTAPIYPLRDHTRGVGLYGIDIAWLLEHNAAWRGFCIGSAGAWSFSRKLLKSQLSAANPADDYYNNKIVKTDYIFLSKSGTSTDDFKTEYASAFLNDIPTIEVPNAPRKDYIEQSFAFVAKKKRTWARRETEGNYSGEITHIEGNLSVELPSAFDGWTYSHEFYTDINSPENGSVTIRENYQYTFDDTEVGSFDCVIFPYTAVYNFYKTPHDSSQQSVEVRDRWFGFHVFNAASATTNANLIYNIGDSIMASHGFSRMIFNGTIDPDYYVWQLMCIGVSTPIVIKRISSRFDF